MSWNSKVIWSEGMLLQPQHLQQQDRFLQQQLESRVSGITAYTWGFTALQIDPQQLALGKIALLSCSGVFPDGTPFDLPTQDALPLPIDIPRDARDCQIVLALPARRPGIPEVSDSQGSDNFARYRTTEQEVCDSNGTDIGTLLQIGQLRVRLALASDVIHAHTTLGVAQVIERRADDQLVLSNDYCPPCLDIRVAPWLGSLTDELVGLLHQRGSALAGRLTQSAAGAAEIADFLLLLLVNRVSPLFGHFSSMKGLHPERLYQAAITLAGELATFSRPDKRANNYPTYNHSQLRESFFPVWQDLRQALSMVMDAHAVPITLEARQYGIWVAVVADKELFRSASFILAVNAQLPPEALRNGFPPKTKMGTVEKIRDLVNLQLPGIGLRPLPVAPRQLPYHAGYTYFELDRSSELWKQLTTSAGFALHVAGDFPGLQMEFWAIRG